MAGILVRRSAAGSAFGMTSLKIEIAKDFSPALLQAIASLLPQLTSSGRAMTAAELKAMIASPLTTLFIAKDDDRIVGTISLTVVQMPTGLRAYLEDLVVDASYRNRGAATALLRRFRALAFQPSRPSSGPQDFIITISRAGWAS